MFQFMKGLKYNFILMLVKIFELCTKLRNAMSLSEGNIQILKWFLCTIEWFYVHFFCNYSSHSHR
jgi:hypothetical protein